MPKRSAHQSALLLRLPGSLPLLPKAGHRSPETPPLQFSGFSFRRSRSISGSVILFFLASIISFWFSSIIYACLTEPAGFSLIPRTFFPIPTAPEDTTIISFPLGWLLIPFRFSSFQFIFLVGINKRSRKRVCGDTFFCFFFHYRIIILQ